MSKERPLNDDVLVQLALDGKAHAFNLLIERHYGTAYAIAYSRIGAREAAEDLAQEAFLRAYLSLGKLREPSRFAAWVCRITRNAAATWKMHSRKHSELLSTVPLEKIADVVPNTLESDAYEKAVATEERHRLSEAIARLPEDIRVVVLLYYGEGLSKVEIAERLELHPSSVGRRLERAMELLRVDLEPVIRAGAKDLRPSRAAVTRAFGIILAVSTMSMHSRQSLAARAETPDLSMPPAEFKAMPSSVIVSFQKIMAFGAIAIVVASCLAYLSRHRSPSSPLRAKSPRQTILHTAGRVSAQESEGTKRDKPALAQSQLATKEVYASNSRPPLQEKIYDWNAPDWRPARLDYFPDNPAGAKKLNEFMQNPEKDRRSPEEILAVVRNGLRKHTMPTEVLSWFGNLFIWGRRPQNPEALEIMYHAVMVERHYANYFGLTVADDHTSNIAHNFAESLMSTQAPDWNDYTRIKHFWTQDSAKLVPYLESYLQDPNQEKRENADALIRYFRDDFDIVKWSTEKHEKKTRTDYGSALPRILQKLENGTPEEQEAAFKETITSGLISIMKPGDVRFFAPLADHPNSSLRERVASYVGGSFIWSSTDQSTDAINLMLRMATDSDREVRYNSLYHGLSTVREPGEDVIRMLIDLAVTDPLCTDRAIWGLKSEAVSKKDIILSSLKRHLTPPDDRIGALVGIIYKDLYEEKPPQDWNLEGVLKTYDGSACTCVVLARDSGMTGKAVMQELQTMLPSDSSLKAVEIKDLNGRTKVQVLCKGGDIKGSLDRAQTLGGPLIIGEVNQLPPVQQFFIEQMAESAPDPK